MTAARATDDLPPGRRFLVYDIGGTHIRAAAYDPESGTLASKIVIPTPSGEVDLADAVPAAGHLAMRGATPAGIALGFPGPIGPGGKALASPTIKCNADLPACEAALANAWGDVPIRVLNDVTAAGYHYVAFDEADFAVVNVGSGIGLKVFLDGDPVVGPNGLGGELGHLVVDEAPDAPQCDCGGKGHLGAIASGRGTLALARRRAVRQPAAYAGSSMAAYCPDARHLDNGLLVAAFLQGDPWARSVVAEGAMALGRQIAALHLAIGLERFYIVGGFALALGEEYRALLASAAASGGWDMGQDWNGMLTLEQNEDTQLLGAGYAMTRCGRAA